MRLLILSYTKQLVIPNVCSKFQNPSCSSSWEIFDKIFIGEKEKWTNKGSDKLILSHSLQVVPSNIYTKFQNPKCSSSWEAFDTNFPMHYVEVRDGKKVKRGQN